MGFHMYLFYLHLFLHIFIHFKVFGTLVLNFADSSIKYPFSTTILLWIYLYEQIKLFPWYIVYRAALLAPLPLIGPALVTILSYVYIIIVLWTFTSATRPKGSDSWACTTIVFDKCCSSCHNSRSSFSLFFILSQFQNYKHKSRTVVHFHS